MSRHKISWPELYSRGMKRRRQECKALYREFRAWMIEREVDPETMRSLFAQMYEEFLNDVE